MRRVKLPFANLKVEFVDREAGLRQFRDWAERGTWSPVVIFGPEGCGKSALLRQAVELLRDYGYSVALVSPLADEPRERFVVTEELRGLAESALSMVLGESAVRLIDAAVELLYRAVRTSVGRRIALLLDDVFQAIGLDKAALLVKRLLNMIEYPSVRYERIVVVAVTSEGISRREIGRHRWAELMPIWNLPRDGFEKLYEQLPGSKPPFEEVWRWTGGNPWVLEQLYKSGWSFDEVVEDIIRRKGLRSFVASLGEGELVALREAVEDPDTLYRRDRVALMERLIDLNLLINEIHSRRPSLWIDQPPPEKDPELGIGTGAAWQTPLHREATKKALEINIRE